MKRRLISGLGVKAAVIVATASLILMGMSIVYGAVTGGEKFDLFKTPSLPGEIRLVGIDGKPMLLSDFKGKVVVLNFWRKDCPYCVIEKDYLKDFAKKSDPQDLEIISINLWDDPSWVRGQGVKLGAQFRVATGFPEKKAFVENVVRGRLMGYYVINESKEAVFEIKGFPSTYVLDKEGRVVAGHTGMVNWNATAIHDTMRSFLKQPYGGQRKAALTETGLAWLGNLMNKPQEINISLLK